MLRRFALASVTRPSAAAALPGASAARGGPAAAAAAPSWLARAAAPAVVTVPARAMGSSNLRMRLQRYGIHKRPFYRIVVTQAWRKRDGFHLDRVGTWNPLPARDGVKEIRLDFEKVRNWLAHGAEPTQRVEWLLGLANLLPLAPQPGWSHKSVPKHLWPERPSRTARKQEKNKHKKLVDNARKVRLVIHRLKKSGADDEKLAEMQALLKDKLMPEVWVSVHARRALLKSRRPQRPVPADADAAERADDDEAA